MLRRPLLLSEPPVSCVPLRRCLLELSFEASEAPSAALLSSSLLGAMAVGKLDATVVDLGAGTATVAPLLSGCLKEESFREPLGAS